MAHNYQPNQVVRIIPIEVAVPADVSADDIANYFIDMFVGQLEQERRWQSHPTLLDWRFADTHTAVVNVGEYPDESVAFQIWDSDRNYLLKPFFKEN